MHLRPWQAAFRVGIAPQLSTDGLAALADALERDDPALLQGSNTEPPAVASGATNDWPVMRACPISLAGWRGDGLTTVAEVNEHFARVCSTCDLMFGRILSMDFVAFVDTYPRALMRELLLDEVRGELYRRRFGRAMTAGCDLMVRA